METCFIALGSNMGNRRGNLVAALELIGRLPGTRVQQVSRFVGTEPVGGPAGQNQYLNAAAQLETVMRPQRLLDRLHEIETKLGRARAEAWGPRTIDLDILLFNRLRLNEPNLTIPHPRMHFRRFVLEPLVEIAPDYLHPDGWTIRQRWDAINRFPHYLAITGPTGVGKTTLARALAAQLDADLVEEQFEEAALGRFYDGHQSQADAVQQSFLTSRRQLLDRRRFQSPTRRWLVSDFWFRQSIAFSELFLTGAAAAQHQADVMAAESEVIEPALVLWLDAPASKLLERIRSRGREFEARLDIQSLEDIRRGFDRLRHGSPAPPLYQPASAALQDLLGEIQWVTQAISGVS